MGGGGKTRFFFRKGGGGGKGGGRGVEGEVGGFEEGEGFAGRWGGNRGGGGGKDFRGGLSHDSFYESGGEGEREEGRRGGR